MKIKETLLQINLMKKINVIFKKVKNNKLKTVKKQMIIH